MWLKPNSNLMNQIRLIGPFCWARAQHFRARSTSKRHWSERKPPDHIGPSIKHSFRARKKRNSSSNKNKNVKKSIFSFSDFLLLKKNFVAPQISMNCNFFVSNRKLLNQCWSVLLHCRSRKHGVWCQSLTRSQPHFAVAANSERNH